MAGGGEPSEKVLYEALRNFKSDAFNEMFAGAGYGPEDIADEAVMFASIDEDIPPDVPSAAKIVIKLADQMKGNEA